MSLNYSPLLPSKVFPLSPHFFFVLCELWLIRKFYFCSFLFIPLFFFYRFRCAMLLHCQSSDHLLGKCWLLFYCSNVVFFFFGSYGVKKISFLYINSYYAEFARSCIDRRVAWDELWSSNELSTVKGCC